MSKHAKNKFKKLPEEIGKGLNEVHAKKALEVRKKLVGILLTETRKEQFKRACVVLGITQNDVLDLAISETIKKALK